VSSSRPMRGLPVLLLLAACGAKSHTPTIKPSFKIGTKVRIADGEQIYDALNTTDCVKWPTAQLKKKAGRDAWGGFKPGTGNEGTVVADLPHLCDHVTEVVLVQVGDYVVPVTSKGIDTGEHHDDAGVGGDSYGVDSYGGMGYGYIYGEGYGGFGYGKAGFGGDSYGGVIGGVVDTNAPTYAVGDEVQITDVTYVMDDPTSSDCFGWPSDDVKSRASYDAWNGWQPSDGETALVSALLTNNCGSTQYLVLDDSGNLVAIDAAGVAHH